MARQIFEFIYTDIPSPHNLILYNLDIPALKQKIKERNL